MSQNLSSFLTSWRNRRVELQQAWWLFTPRLGGSAYGSIRYAYGFDVSGKSNPKSNPLPKGATLETVCRRVSSSLEYCLCASSRYAEPCRGRGQCLRRLPWW
jgi:hypothetical protein